MVGIIPRDRLDSAAIAVHHILTDKNFDHTFFGGYELQIMGCPRGTKDIDVVVKKPLFNGFAKIKQAFVDNSEFKVFDGNRTDGIRAIHTPSGVGIDIMLQDLPKGSINLSDDPNQLPFFTAMHMFIKKIECLAVRKKESDREDLIFLFDNFPLDQGKINKKVLASQRDEALEKHSGSTCWKYWDRWI